MNSRVLSCAADGKDGFLPYFNTEMGVVAQKFFGRAFGAMLTSIAAGHFMNGASAEYCKVMAVGAILMLWPMFQALTGGDDFPFIWKPQVVMHLALCYILSKAGNLI